MTAPALVALAHGSRDPRSAQTIKALTEVVACMRPDLRVEAAFLDLCGPSFDEVVERLAAEGFGKQPPVAYRALDFLVEQGLAHRVRRLNAYAACVSDQRDHSPAFLICRQCETVAEAESPELREALAGLCAANGFAPERRTVELLGLCSRCAGGAA